MTPEAILAVIEEKRAIHPELARPLTWNGLRRILAREDVALVVTENPSCEAMLMSFDGKWAVIIDSNSPARRHCYYATHELGHLWLHHDPFCDRSERIYNMQEYEGDDPREGDAELFCVFVLGGKRFRRTF